MVHQILYNINEINKTKGEILMCKECQHNEEEVIEVEVCTGDHCNCEHCSCKHQESPMTDMIELRRKNMKFVIAFDLLAIITLIILAVFL